MKRFSLRLEKELHEKLRRESFETEASINEIVTKLIEEKYKENKEMKTL
jgi:predicted HicB family RNase H-like nuclease